MILTVLAVAYNVLALAALVVCAIEPLTRKRPP